MLLWDLESHAWPTERFLPPMVAHYPKHRGLLVPSRMNGFLFLGDALRSCYSKGNRSASWHLNLYYYGLLANSQDISTVGQHTAFSFILIPSGIQLQHSTAVLFARPLLLHPLVTYFYHLWVIIRISPAYHPVLDKRLMRRQREIV